MPVSIGKLLGSNVGHKKNSDIGPQKGSATRDTEIARFF